MYRASRNGAAYVHPEEDFFENAFETTGYDDHVPSAATDSQGAAAGFANAPVSADGQQEYALWQQQQQQQHLWVLQRLQLPDALAFAQAAPPGRVVCESTNIVTSDGSSASL